MAQNSYTPFPSILDHQLRRASELLEDNSKNLSDKVYILRQILAETHATGHQEGFQVGMNHTYILGGIAKQSKD